MVDMVGNICCESPVVSTILEKVEYGHSSMGETVNELGLKDSFCVVEWPTASGNTENNKVIFLISKFEYRISKSEYSSLPNQ